MKGLGELFVVAWMLFGEYLLVLLAAMADLWSGIRKAKQRGEVRSSYGFKRTIDKLARYYNMLIALTVVDCMQMGGVWYLDNYYDYHLPIFPLITLLGAIGIGAIEVRSIYEKADDKIKNEYQQVAILATEIAKRKDDPNEIAKAIIDYINKDKEVKDETKG